MSESPSEANPQILVNGEQQQDDAAAAAAAAAVAEEQNSFVCLEDVVAPEKETQAKVQSVFQQVRNQIRSQVAVKAPKSSIMELVQRVKETGVTQVNGEDKDVNGEDSRDKMEELREVFEKKLEASQRALKEEFEVQVSQVRKEMQVYTDQALRDLECKMLSWQSLSHHKEESKGPNRTNKTTAATPLAARRGRVLTRTMTTIIPKTCPPVIIGPRAKSETLSSSKGACSRLLLRDPVLALPGNKSSQSRKPAPPTCPPLHQYRKPVRPKAKTGS